MKQIEAISMWDKGISKSATILNAYAVNVSLGNSANFYYSLLTESMEALAQGNLVMDGEDYQKWTDSDDYAWDFIAGQLNLVVVGDYVKPEPIVEVVEPIIIEPIVENDII